MRSEELVRQFEEIHRREWGRSVAAICKASRDLQLAEDCVQDAFASALKTWRATGVPNNPGAWIRTAARRRLIDFMRRRKTHLQNDGKLKIEAELNAIEEIDEEHLADRIIDDDELALIFLCCHPAISPTDQVMLTLRIVAGLTPKDIAAAFFADHEAIRTRLLRSKRKIKAARIPASIPAPGQLEERFRQVHAVMYLIFNEGYLSSRQDNITRADLTYEAMRLCKTLFDLAPGNSESCGLYALMLLTDARAPARIAESDALISLDQQNRYLWRKDQIVEGFDYLRRAFGGGVAGRYTLQAAIAAEHAKAATYDRTNWGAIVALYDRLIEVEDSPVYRLNRCIALSYKDGPIPALEDLSLISDSGLLSESYQLIATRADLLARVGRLEEAIKDYRMAIDQLPNGSIKAFLAKKLATLNADGDQR